MLNTIEKTVATYVQLNDRQALEDLRTYRQRLAVHLKAIDSSSLTSQIDAEIAVIEAGLDRLNSAPSSMSTTGTIRKFLPLRSRVKCDGAGLRSRSFR